MNPAVIVDVDLTLCDPYGQPIPQGIEFALRHYRAGRRVLVVTAREERWRQLTADWLRAHLPVPYVDIWMRRDGDARPDPIVKREIWQRLVWQYAVCAAIDDRPDVLDLWRALGIPEVEACRLAAAQ